MAVHGRQFDSCTAYLADDGTRSNMNVQSKSAIQSAVESIVYKRELILPVLVCYTPLLPYGNGRFGCPLERCRLAPRPPLVRLGCCLQLPRCSWPRLLVGPKMPPRQLLVVPAGLLPVQQFSSILLQILLCMIYSA